MKSGHCFHILEVTATGIIISKFLLFSLTISSEFDAALRSKIQNHTEMNTLRTTEYSELQGTHKDHPVQLLSDWLERDLTEPSNQLR